MKYLLLTTLFSLLSCLEISPIKSQNKFENKLKYEKSPYLKQHAHNPVWWYPWGDEAFERARSENKIIFLSIGYSTCHWCHVMEKESFENVEVANFLNKHFVAIKVDREERPDIDKIYMNSLHLMGQRGGWPLSMFLTPGLKPFTGGTYFPKQGFMDLLGKIQDIWKKDPKKVKGISAKISEYLKVKPKHESQTISEDVLLDFYNISQKRFDAKFGGFGNAPKFPSTMRLRALMRIARRSNQKKITMQIEKMVNTSLIAMFRGGIYDHIGGGFSRYATDRAWLTPHFEKMLYDNALLAITYFEAFQLTQNKLFKLVGSDILNFVLREMQSPAGGFYSSQDADSDGEEGKFYVWSEKELKSLLNGNEFSLLKNTYGVSTSGNFEHGKNILNLIDSKREEQVFNSSYQSLKHKLYNIRENRIHPFKDTKILTSWNGLMVSAMALGYQVTKNSKYLSAAKKTIDFIKNKMVGPKGLLHRYIDGSSAISANRNDYAYLIEGLLYLYESEFDEKYFNLAARFQSEQDLLWSDKDNGFLFSAPTKNKLPTNIEFSDNARPNSNAVSVLNLLKLYHLTYQDKYLNRAKSMLATNMLGIKKYPSGHGQLLLALDFYTDSVKEVALIGDIEEPFLNLVRSQFFPSKVVASKQNGAKSSIPLLQSKTGASNKFTAYVCEDKVCLLPTSNFNIFKKQLSIRKTIFKK